MNRFIYRAISDDLNKFVYGGYLKFLPYTPSPIRKDENDVPPEEDYKHLIFTEGFSDWNLPRDIKVYTVKPETVGQCTGMKIDYDYLFEGDIVQAKRSYGTHIGVVTFGIADDGNFGFYIKWQDSELNQNLTYWISSIKIIGNIHENLEIFDNK